MRWARKRSYHGEVKFEAIKRTHVNKEVTFLKMDELKRIEGLTLGDRLDAVRDLFLLGCYTGLRYSDLVRLSDENIGEGVLLVRTKKDEDRLEIPLSTPAKRIIKKYEGKSLSKISNQKGNDYLKEIAQKAELSRRVLVTKWDKGKRADKFVSLSSLVSWHLARRTFITLSLELGMDPAVIIKITGHADIRPPDNSHTKDTTSSAMPQMYQKAVVYF